MDKLLEEAVHQYMDKGWLVFPVSRKSKTPLFTHDKAKANKSNYYKTSWNAPDFSSADSCDMFSRAMKEDCSIAVITGRKSGIDVLDCDCEETYKGLVSKYKISTLTAKTGNGYHLYFKYSGKLTVSRRIKGFDKLDIRSDAGYIIAPPSFHPSGCRYKWVVRKQPTDVPEELLKDIVEIKRVDKAEAEARVLKITQGIEKGSMGRIPSAMTLFGHMAASKISLEVATELALAWNERNKPSIDNNDLIKKLVYVFAKERSKEYIEEGQGTSGFLRNFYVKHLQDKSKYKEKPELTTGFNHLDKTLWGYVRGKLHVLVGKPGGCKTVCIIKSAYENAKVGKKVLIFPTESTRNDVMDRIGIMYYGVNGNNSLSGRYTTQEVGRLTNQMFPDLEKFPLLVCEHDSPDLNMIQAEIKKHRPDIVYIDYFQEVDVSENPYDAKRFAKDLKRLAKDNDLAMVVTSQVNVDWSYDKESGKFKEGRVSFWKVRSSQGICHSANVGISLNTKVNQLGDRYITFEVEKSKDTGLCKMYTRFTGNTMGFAEISKNEYYEGIM